MLKLHAALENVCRVLLRLKFRMLLKGYYQLYDDIPLATLQYIFIILLYEIINLIILVAYPSRNYDG